MCWEIYMHFGRRESDSALLWASLHFHSSWVKVSLLERQSLFIAVSCPHQNLERTHLRLLNQKLEELTEEKSIKVKWTCSVNDADGCLFCNGVSPSMAGSEHQICLLDNSIEVSSLWLLAILWYCPSENITSSNFD